MKLNQKQIREILDHRYPFLFVDKILSMDEQSAIGIKNVSATDPYLVGHFPDNPIYPGVLLIESCSQVGGLLFTNYYTGRGFLAQIKNFKFLKFIEPGDTIIIETHFLSKLGNFAQIESVAKVDNQVVGKGEIFYTFIDNIKVK